MITTSHIIYSWSLFTWLNHKKPNRNVLLHAIIAGALFPDISIFLFYWYYRFIGGVSDTTIWSDLYFNSPWSVVITLSHSFIIWPALLVVAILFSWPILRWLSFGALMHSVTDFFVHNSDAYAHLLPLSNWKFTSPISYWDPNYYGILIGRLDAIFILMLLFYLYKQTKSKLLKRSIVLLVLFYSFAFIGPHAIIH